VRIGDTPSVSAELQAMVRTLDGITQMLSHVQWSEAMGAPVEHRHGRAICLSEQEHRLVEKTTMQQLSDLELRRPPRLVPRVAKVSHAHLSPRGPRSKIQTQPCSMRQGTGSNDCPRHAPCVHTPVSGSKWAPWP
jgi:hypothetical protein